MTLQQAHDLFNKGQFGHATKISAQLIQNGTVATELTPLAKCLSYQTVVCHLLGKPHEAYQAALAGMRYTHYDQNLAKAFEFLKDEGVPFEPGPIVFGLGTGRSGSTSLASMLNSPEGNYVTHEHPFIVRWALGEEEVDWHLRRMAWLSRYYSLVGDVAHWWLPYVEFIMDKCPSSVFIAVKRDKDSTVRSFVRHKLRPDGRFMNHWTNHDGEVFHKNLWDSCYPKYESNMPINDALDLYWQEYYDECERLVSKYPNRVAMIDLNNLSDSNTLEAALHSLGVSTPTPLRNFKKNVGSNYESAEPASVPLRALG